MAVATIAVAVVVPIYLAFAVVALVASVAVECSSNWTELVVWLKLLFKFYYINQGLVLQVNRLGSLKIIVLHNEFK